MDSQISGLIAIVGEQRVTETGLRQLDDVACEYVQLASWTANDAATIGSEDVDDVPTPSAAVPGAGTLDPDSQAAHPIYYGFNGRLFAQLFPGETTGLIPVNNLRQICAKAGVGDTLVLRYVCFTRPKI